MPSIPIFSSMYSTPPSAQRVTSSSAMVREASAMSISPAHSRPNPSPVPGPSTKPVTSVCVAVKASNTWLLMGSTVEDPEIWMSPLRASPLGAALPGSLGDSLADG